MPNNGVAVALPLALDPPSERSSKDAPAKTSTSPQEGVEHRVGVAVADAVAAVSRGCYEHGWGGGTTPTTKSLGAERISALYWLSQSSGPDFEAMARTEGRRVLQERLGADAHEAAIDVIIDGVLEILGKVSTYMRAMAH